PGFRLVEDGSAFVHAEQRQAPLGRQVAQLPRLLAVDAVDRGELAPELLVQRGIEPGPDEQQNARGEDAYDQRQHARVPQGQARADTEGTGHHCARPSEKPTPRTVCSSFFSNGSSILRRSRATVTSMTLSSGVARAVTCQTSLASISRETTRPLCRRRYSRMSNSFTVRSRACDPREARRVTRSISRSSCCSLRIWSSRPRRTSARIRASSSGRANGLTR